MKKTLTKAVSWMLALVLIASALFVFTPTTTKAAPETDTDIQDGVTLHCWNWSFKEIEAKLETISALGYTSIQTSPIQQAKQATLDYPSNDWWVYYQPMGFHIDDSGNSALGTKADFEKMCQTAHKYGIKVIVDVVANHMGNAATGAGLSATIIDDLKNDPDCWHDLYKNTGNYNDRYEVTQYCMAGLPDLNTSNKKVQNYVLNYLKECIDAGADGFRFDAVKHIETPDDGNIASDFWPTVIDGAEDYAESKGLDLYCYGELLDNPCGSLSVSSDTMYMSITDNTWSANVLSNVVGNGNAGGFSANYHKRADADDLVLWAESHDTFADGTTDDVPVEDINKTWALIAARKDAMSLYLARPANMSQLLGFASNTGWAYPEVAAVNHFHTTFIGQDEYIANENGIAYVERGNAGVILVNCKGNGTTVNVTAHAMADGTYTDRISGSTFTVSSGKISGTIGDTGIAVVYETDACAHEVHDTNGFCTECSALVGHDYDANGTCACGDKQVEERVVYFVNTDNWAAVNFYSWYDDVNIFTNAWPGNPMTKVGDQVYSCTVPADIPNIIFNNTDGIQTEDLMLPAVTEGKDMYDFSTGTWSTYSAESEKPDDEEDTKPTDPTEESKPTNDSSASQNKDEDDDNDPTVWIAIIVGTLIVVAIIIVMVVMAKKGKK